MTQETTDRIRLVNFLTALAVLICIPAHILLLAQAEKGEVSELVKDVFQISLIAFIILFMAVCAGLAVYYWKKVSADPVSARKLPKYPKKSLIAAVLATVVFTVYWGIQLV